ncbi:hypothetical protein oki184_39110 [Helicobacter pylori]
MTLKLEKCNKLNLRYKYIPRKLIRFLFKVLLLTIEIIKE